MLNLPVAPKSANERALSSFVRERLTGLSTAVVTLNNSPISGFETVYKNGSLVDPNSYTVSGKTITLGSALVGADVVVVVYYFRGAS